MQCRCAVMETVTFSGTEALTIELNQFKYYTVCND